MKIYKVADGKELRGLAKQGGAITGLKYTPNGQQIVTSSADKSVRIWNAADGKPVRKIDQPVGITSLALSANGSQIVIGLADKTVRTLNLGDGKPLATYTGHTAAITSARFSRDNNRIDIQCQVAGNGQRARTTGIITNIDDAAGTVDVTAKITRTGEFRQRH